MTDYSDIPNFAPDKIPDANNPETFHDDATYVFSHLNNAIIPSMNTNINDANASIAGIDDKVAAAAVSESNAATSEINASASALAAAASAGDAVGGLAYTEQNSAYEISALEGVIADTSAGAWTLTLPATPSHGDYVIVSDGADWAVHNLTLNRNGSTIEGIAENLVLNIGNISLTLVYAFDDWKVYTQMGSASGVVVTENAPQTLTNKVIDTSQLTGSIQTSSLTGAMPALDGSSLVHVNKIRGSAYIYWWNNHANIATQGRTGLLAFANIQRTSAGDVHFDVANLPTNYIVEIHFMEVRTGDNRNNTSLSSHTSTGFSTRITNVHGTAFNANHYVVIREV